MEIYENEVGPQLGAKVVARAWTDPGFKQRLLADATKACADFGIGGLQGEDMVVVENTAGIHNVIVCTLCSCYPWPVLGLPPNWYKEPAYRSRIVKEPRKVLREDFGYDATRLGRGTGLGLQLGNALLGAAHAPGGD